LWLQKQVEVGEAVMEGNIYKRWMEDYSGEDFLGAVDRGIGESFLFPLHLARSSLPRLRCTQSDLSSSRNPHDGIICAGADSRKPREKSRSRTTLA